MRRLFDADDPSILKIHAQLAHLVTLARHGTFVAAAPSSATHVLLSELIETAFWASLRSNEGRSTRVNLVLATPGDLPSAIAFLHEVDYDEIQLAKLAPAVPSTDRVTVCANGAGALVIWGLLRGETRFDTIEVETFEPGVVRVHVGMFRPFAVLNGRENPEIAGGGGQLLHYLHRVLKKGATPPTDDFIEYQATFRECGALGELAQRIVSNGHGGVLLIVPSESGLWVDHLSPFAYRFSRPDATLARSVRSGLDGMRSYGVHISRLSEPDVPKDLRDMLLPKAAVNTPSFDHEACAAIATWANVDGAMVATADLQILGFGATMAVPPVRDIEVACLSFNPGSPPGPRQSLSSLPVGTRHQSAVRFVDAHRDVVAIVVSQDRHLSIVHWLESQGVVAFVRDVAWSL